MFLQFLREQIAISRGLSEVGLSLLNRFLHFSSQYFPPSYIFNGRFLADTIALIMYPKGMNEKRVNDKDDSGDVGKSAECFMLAFC